MPTGVFIFFAAVGVLVLTIFAARRLVCGKPWGAARKKAVFAAVCAFVLFPVLMPAGTIAGIPMPNIVVVVMATWMGHPEGIFYLYAAFWKASLASFAMTWIFFRVIAAMVLFENSHKPVEG